VTRHEQRAFDDSIAGVVEILLDHRDALLQHAGFMLFAAAPRSVPQSSPMRLRSFALTAARNCVIDSFIDCGIGAPAPGFSRRRCCREQEQRKREPSLHEARPVWSR